MCYYVVRMCDMSEPQLPRIAPHGVLTGRGYYARGLQPATRGIFVISQVADYLVTRTGTVGFPTISV